jgi:hypothetical protein
MVMNKIYGLVYVSGFIFLIGCSKEKVPCGSMTSIFYLLNMDKTVVSQKSPLSQMDTIPYSHLDIIPELARGKGNELLVYGTPYYKGERTFIYPLDERNDFNRLFQFYSISNDTLRFFIGEFIDSEFLYLKSNSKSIKAYSYFQKIVSNLIAYYKRQEIDGEESIKFKSCIKHLLQDYYYQKLYTSAFTKEQ